MSSHLPIMNQSARSKQCSNNDNFTGVKQEIIDEKFNVKCKPIANELLLPTPCQSVLKCEYDPDCGCKQCRFNANTTSGTLQQIKIEGDCDYYKVQVKNEFVQKCVKNEVCDEEDCGCNECLGVGSSKQYDHHKAQTEIVQPIKGEDIINQNYDNFSDCPTPDYLPPFFSEDDDEEEEESEDEVNRSYSSSRRSTRVATRPQKTYREEHSESDSDRSEYEPSEDEDIDEESEEEETEQEDNVDILKNTTKSNKPIDAKNRNKKFKPSHTNKVSTQNGSSSNVIDIEILRKKKIKGKFSCKILTLRLSCSECDETFKDSHSLNGHLKKRHKIFKFRCHVRGCSASFSHPTLFRPHLLTEHGHFTKNWPCGLCPLEMFNSYRLLAHHVWKIHQEGQFRCAYDGCQFESHSTRTVLINHYLISHNETTFTCQFKGCGMTFANKSKLNRHSQVHSREKAFECDICKNSYPRNDHLRKHQFKVHQIGKMVQYGCKWTKCTFVSIDRSGTIRHIQCVHLKNGDQRDPKEFLAQKEITKNQVKTNKGKPTTVITLRLNCPVDDCSDHFPNKDQLFVHLSKCHQIGKFRCVVRGCLASFHSMVQLSTHKKEVHGLVKVWHCGKCDYQGKTYTLLSNHITNAHDEGHFACGHAGCRFVSHYNRLEVMKHRHSRHH